MITAQNTVLQHSQALKQYVIDKISQSHGQIPFSEYMHHILYAPGLGYYNAGSIKFGAAGDFITAPELGNIFAKSLSVQIAEVLTNYTHPVILELGAGSGRLACDLLLALADLNMLPQQYYILEVSADLRDRQQDLIFNKCPQHAHLVQWLDTLPHTPINGVIFANEVLDAMPCTKFLLNTDQLHEYYVTYDNNDTFNYVLQPASNTLTHAYQANNLKDYISGPYTSELNLWINSWLESLNACLENGAILLCDYGFTRAQYYHPQRNQGTLMCHFQHQAHDNPFINIGLQDVTAHVDFTHVAEAAITQGLYVAGFTNLASFLINCGIINFMSHDCVRSAHEINVLTSPAEMGELFKVIMLTRMQNENFIGFSNYDKTHTL